jgi:hypothetical protein
LEVKMRDWGKALVRVFGVLNLLYGAAGAYFVLDGVVRVSQSVHHFAKFRYEPIAFDTELAINALFLAGLILAGYWLVRLDRRGIVLSNYVFSLEIFFWLATATVDLAFGMSHNRTAKEIGSSMAAVGGIANMGTVLQTITAYPIVGLVVLNIARRRMNRKALWRTLEPSNQQS